MDELEDLLGSLREEQPPAEALDRVGPRVRTALRRRTMTRWVLAAAAVLALVVVNVPRNEEPIALPDPVRAIIPVPDLFLPAPAPAPVMLSSHRARPKPTLVDDHTLQLPSSDPNIKILWSLE